MSSPLWLDMYPRQKPDTRFQFYQVKRVFLACPGDLTAERSRLPRLLETVNNLRAHSLGFHLQPVGWERVIPSFGRPQTLINLELYAADLVVVMFWNRIGSPSSPDSTRSGTIEEFEEGIRLHNETGGWPTLSPGFGEGWGTAAPPGANENSPAVHCRVRSTHPRQVP